MASPSSHCLLFCSLLVIFQIITTLTLAETSFRPKALVLPVTKDASTLQYLTSIKQRTPLVSLKLTVDLGGQYLWVDCDDGYVSSTYKPSHCKSAQCSLAKSPICTTCNAAPSPGCHNNTCGFFPVNSVTGLSTGAYGQLGQDAISGLHSADGSNPGRVVSVPNLIFTCAGTSLLQGLANGVKGVAGLGRSKIGLPSQFAAAFSFHRKFAICLSSSKGVAFFGNAPYNLGGVDASKNLSFTPLITKTNYLHYGVEQSAEYFIGVKSIKIGGKHVSVNTTLLAIDEMGNGGTTISTVNPYSVLETSIYNAVVNAFVKVLKMKHILKVASVAPFGACFNAKDIAYSRATGPVVPPIDLVLQSEGVYWRIVGANSMVRVSNEVLCLGFVDGGVEPRTSIVIGGHQSEDNLLQFDLAANRLGFSSSLLSRQTSCANFNFTSTT